MRKEVKKQEMTSTQLFLLSYQTCQWWNAVIIQAQRFFDVLEKEHGGTPWDNGDENSMFIAERMFLITAIYHAIENLQKFDVELQRNNDYSMKSVLQEIEKVALFDDIKNLRDMNEHGLDYLVNKGRKQEQFHSTVIKDDYKIITTAAWTHINGDKKMILLGNVQVDKLLIVMKKQLEAVRDKTKEVFNKELVGDNR